MTPQKPVAWQFKDSEWTEWASISEGQYEAYRSGRHPGSGNSFEIRALYAETPSMAAKVAADQAGKLAIEAAAIGLWHRFSHEDEMDWEDSPDKVIYLDAARDAISAAAMPCPDCRGTGGDRWLEADGSENGEKCGTCDGFGSVQPHCSKCVELDRVNKQLHDHGTAVYANLTALRSALTEYPKKNPQQMQAAKVCAGVMKLAGETGHE